MKFIVKFRLVTSQWIQSVIQVSHFELHSVTIPSAILCASVPACSASWCVSPVAPPQGIYPGGGRALKKSYCVSLVKKKNLLLFLFLCLFVCSLCWCGSLFSVLFATTHQCLVAPLCVQHVLCVPHLWPIYFDWCLTRFATFKMHISVYYVTIIVLRADL
jgi:hypothetical protein